MILKLTLATAAIIVVSACTQQQQFKPKDTPVVSETLEGKNKSSIISKRGTDNVVVSMYNEIAAKTPALQQLEEQLDRVRKMTVDSTADFNEYDFKSQNYYKTATNMSGQLHDSAVRKTLIAAIGASAAGYHQKVAGHDLLQKLIASRNITVNELYIVLQVMRTLPVMEQYQQQNLPSARAMQEANRQLDELIRKLGAAVQKNNE